VTHEAIIVTDKQKHKQWRQAFREGCLARDKNRCVVCGSTESLDVHHIADRHQMPNGGYVLSNGITLCGGDNPESCHMKAERYHASGYAEWFDGYLPFELYELIGSSQLKAYDDSLKLS